MDDATLLRELRATHERVDEAMSRMEAIHLANTLQTTELKGHFDRLEQKVDLRHQALQEQVDDVCGRTDSNTAEIGEFKTQARVNKARLGVVAILGGTGALSLKELWHRLVSIFVDS